MYTVAEDHMGDNEIAQVYSYSGGGACLNHLKVVVTSWTCSRLQVIAFICGIIVILLMIMGLASTDWLMALGWRQGLFAHCIEEGAPTPLPFNMPDPPGCYQARDNGTIRLV